MRCCRERPTPRLSTLPNCLGMPRIETWERPFKGIGGACGCWRANAKNTKCCRMESYIYFLGIDVSKDTLDLCLRDCSRRLASLQVPNTASGVRKALKDLHRHGGFLPGLCLACIEHTGIYVLPALHGLHAGGVGVWHESPAAIRNGAGGIQRGKSDKVDAARIADYAWTFRAKARLWSPPRMEVVLLADLLATRGRLLGVVHKLSVPAAELARFKGKGHAAAAGSGCRRTVAAARLELGQLENAITSHIRSDSRLERLYSILTSVRGVGMVTACTLIAATNEFIDINNPRKLACHAGCAPFDHRSGTSVRGRARVSHRANKRLKSLLHMCAMSAVRRPGEMADYYRAKTAGGKEKFVAINAVRNKIIHRICACVRDDREYQATPPPRPA
jgi:transposase